MNNNQDFEECAASGESHKFTKQSIPSEFITGIDGDKPTEVVQCEYCGKLVNE